MSGRNVSHAAESAQVRRLEDRFIRREPDQYRSPMRADLQAADKKGQSLFVNSKEMNGPFKSL